MLWLAAAEFGDDGNMLGIRFPELFLKFGNRIERQNKATFFQVYQDWAKNGVQ